MTFVQKTQTNLSMIASSYVGTEIEIYISVIELSLAKKQNILQEACQPVRRSGLRFGASRLHGKLSIEARILSLHADRPEQNNAYARNAKK